MQTDYSDQVKIFNPETFAYPVHLIGAGGINNLVGPVLAKMGVKTIHVWDDDILECRNCPTEVAYSYTMIGQPKCTALSDAIHHLNPTTSVYTHIERVEATTKLSGIIISGVDSMASRQTIWQCIKENFLEIPLYIDARSAGEITEFFSFSPSDFDIHADYESWLFDDDEALKLECGARNIGYISAYMAYEIPRIITRFHKDDEIAFRRNFDHSQIL